jgi:hypothetical protein
MVFEDRKDNSGAMSRPSIIMQRIFELNFISTEQI